MVLERKLLLIKARHDVRLCQSYTLGYMPGWTNDLSPQEQNRALQKWNGEECSTYTYLGGQGMAVV